MAKVFTPVLLSGLLCSLAACSNDPVDLGHDDPHALGSALSDYAGIWQGYAEAFPFDDGSDRVHLQIGPDGTGELLVGEAPLLPPPQADHAYPPGDVDPKDAYPGPGGARSGFPYPVVDAVVADNRIRMHSSTAELYREWCDIMTPHLVVNTTPSYYACLPISGFGSDEEGQCLNGVNGDEVIDCGLVRCLSVCQCTESDCELGPSALPDIEIDATLEGDGDSFVGTLVLENERITVRLTRM